MKEPSRTHAGGHSEAATTSARGDGAQAHGSDTGAAVWQALALLFDKRGAPLSVATVAALAALATCDGSCTAALQAAALKAAAWGVLRGEDRAACAKTLFRALISEHPGAGSSRQKLLTQLCEHGLMPPSVLPPMTGRAGPRVDAAFLGPCGEEYDVKCFCVHLKRPSARLLQRGGRSRELERCVAAMVPVGGRHVHLRTCLPQPTNDDNCSAERFAQVVDDHFEDLDVASEEVQLLAQFEELEGESEASDGRDVYMLFAPYAPHIGGPHFPGPALQSVLRAPPPEWAVHGVTADTYDSAVRPDRFIFGGRLRGDSREGEEADLADLDLSGLSSTVWLFLAVKARPGDAGSDAEAAAADAAAEGAAGDAAGEAAGDAVEGA